MAVIYLYGYLGKKYGKRFELAVHSVGEAVALLNANFNGFHADISRHRAGWLVKMDGRQIVDRAGVHTTAISPEIHIVPAIAGAGGKSGGGQILLAAVLIVASIYAPELGMSRGMQQGFLSSGISLAVSGVATLLFSSSTIKNGATSDEITGETNKASYAFNGPVNTTAQGNPVPVLYGRLRVGSQVVSAGISSA